MAYQPKFARKKDRVSPFFVLLGVIVVPISLALTAVLLGKMVQSVGHPKAAAQTAPADMTIMEQFDGFVSAKMDAARDTLTAAQTPENVPETTVPVREKVIIEIPDDAQVAPEPNPDCYGQTDDPSSLQWLLDEAAFLLDGQELYFSTDVELFEGSLVNYYLDDTIFAITWKEVHDGSVYTFSEVKVNHPSQFRRHLAGGEYGSATQFYTSEMAESVNAVVASSGDFYNFRNFGIIVYQGQVRKVEGTYAETCYIDRNGDLHFTYGGDITTTAAAKEYVAENDIWFSLGFGPVLIDNYEVIDHTWYGVGEITEGYARAALCQMGTRHYLIVTANHEEDYPSALNIHQFAERIALTGCQKAYTLDGGQTAAIALDGKLVNRVLYGQQRSISDIIYFATSVGG
mgnify:CR=1 FL=1